MSRIVITDKMRRNYRQHFEWMLKARGYAVPIHTHVDSKTAEREVLLEMMAEGLCIESKRRVDKDGFPNPRGKSFETIYVPATPRHDLAAQIKTLGADSLLPDWKP